MIGRNRVFAALAGCVLAGWIGVVAAKVTPEDVLDPGPPHPDVAGVIAGQRLQAEIVYLRPSTDFRPEDAGSLIVEPDPEPEARGDDVALGRGATAVVMIALLVGLAILIGIYGGSISVSFRGQPEGGKRDRDDEAAEAERAALMAQPIDSFLDSLRRMGDRRAALILLVSRALERAALLNDLRLGRSQTAREVLRILPRSWRHLATMRQLVREAEIVHFGGRDLSEGDWEACLAAARPIFAEPVRA